MNAAAETRRQTVVGPIVQRRANLDPSGIIDAEQRLVRVSFSSETPYRRSGGMWGDPWVEVLGHRAEEVELSMLSDGGAVLFGHGSLLGGVSDHIGTVRRAWIEAGRGYAELQISRAADVDPVWQRITEGTLTKISVGYQIQERTLTRAADDGDEYRVTKWTPREISFVSIPADPTVGVGRSAGDDAPAFTFTDIKESTMDDDVTRDAGTKAPETPANPAPTVDPTDARRAADEAVSLERKRIAEITRLCQRAGLSGDFQSRLINDGVALDAARSQIIDEWANAAPPRTDSNRATLTADERDKFRRGINDWLMVRAGKADKDTDPGEFRGMSLIDTARECLTRAGVTTRGMDRMALVGRAFTHSTSDFSTILEEALHKMMTDAYRIAPDTWRQFCAVDSVSDFRPHNFYTMGSFGDLDDLTELAEYKSGTISDADKEQVAATTKGKMISISRQMIVNDDMGAFTRLAPMMGRAAARAIEKAVYTSLESNTGGGPTLDRDNVALFNAAHSNLATAGAITLANLDAARVLMANQMDKDSNDYLDIVPSILLCGVSQATTARKVIQSETDISNANSATANPLRNFVRVVESRRLTLNGGNNWYLFADPSDIPAMIVVFLDGQQSPYLEMQEGFTVDGIRWKVRLDFGVDGMDFRGAVRNPYTG